MIKLSVILLIGVFDMIKEKDKLIELIKILPDNYLIELSDYIEYLFYKDKKDKKIDLNEYYDKIIKEDGNLLSRLAK